MEVATWAVAVVTFLAVAVALFREEIVGLWRRPNLKARIMPAPPDCHLTTMTLFDGNRVLATSGCYYLRLWIENTGRVRAEQVQVSVAKVAKRQADQTFQDDPNFLPMNLKWSHSQPEHPDIFTTLNPKMGRHVDLGHILHPKHSSAFAERHARAQEGQTTMALDLEVRPATQSHLLPPGDYRLTLKMAGSNVRPITREVEIAHTGDWYPDEDTMFRDGIGITVIG